MSKNETKPRIIVIAGSARRDGNILKAISNLIPFRHYDLVDLSTKNIQYYQYPQDGKPEDDFLKIGKSLLNYDTIVLATPVYWYTMSGQMKVFLDRISDFLDCDKPMARALAKKKVYLIACGGQPNQPEGFELPFKFTCEYLDMEYQKCFYQQIRDY